MRDVFVFTGNIRSVIRASSATSASSQKAPPTPSDHAHCRHCTVSVATVASQTGNSEMWLTKRRPQSKAKPLVFLYDFNQSTAFSERRGPPRTLYVTRSCGWCSSTSRHVLTFDYVFKLEDDQTSSNDGCFYKRSSGPKDRSHNPLLWRGFDGGCETAAEPVTAFLTRIEILCSVSACSFLHSHASSIDLCRQAHAVGNVWFGVCYSMQTSSSRPFPACGVTLNRCLMGPAVFSITLCFYTFCWVSRPGNSLLWLQCVCVSVSVWIWSEHAWVHFINYE